MFDGRVKDMLTRVNETSQAMYNKKLSEFKASNTNAVIHFLLRISSPYYRGLLKDFSGLKSKIFFLIITECQYFRSRSRRPCVLRCSSAVARLFNLQPLYCRDLEFESRPRHGCSSLVFLVCCVGSGMCDKLITHSKKSHRYVCVCVCVCV